MESEREMRSNGKRELRSWTLSTAEIRMPVEQIEAQIPKHGQLVLVFPLFLIVNNVANVAVTATVPCAIFADVSPL